MSPAHQMVAICRMVSLLSEKRLWARVTGTTKAARLTTSSSSRIQNIQATSCLLVLCVCGKAGGHCSVHMRHHGSMSVSKVALAVGAQSRVLLPARPPARPPAHLPLQRVQGVQAAVDKDDSLGDVAQGVEGVDGSGAGLRCSSRAAEAAEVSETTGAAVLRCTVVQLAAP